MITAWTEYAWEEYLQWQKEDEKILIAINDLIKDIKRNPFKGLGKPEPLKHDLAGWWSRRISGEHRLVYRVSGKGESRATRHRPMPLPLLAGSAQAKRPRDSLAISHENPNCQKIFHPPCAMSDASPSDGHD